MNNRRVALLCLVFASTGAPIPALADDAATARLELIKKLEEERRSGQLEVEAARGRLKQIKEINDWAVKDFQDRRHPETPPGPVFALHERWRLIDARAARRFVDFDSGKSSAAIRTGSALNFFLDSLGDLALQHDRFLKRGTPPPGAEVGVQDRRESLLADIEGVVRIDKSVLNAVQLEYGLGGPKVRVRLTGEEGRVDAELLPLTWPSYFKGTPELVRRTEAVEASRRKALLELAADIVGGPEQQRLMKDIDDLQRAFNDRYQQSLARHRTNADRAARLGMFDPSVYTDVGEAPYRLIEASKFMTALRLGTCRLIECKGLKLSPLRSQRPDAEVYTAVQLLAYMRSEGLRFAPATPEAEGEYQKLFIAMASYYRTLASLQAAVQESQGELAEAEDKVEKLLKQQLELATRDAGEKDPNILGWLQLGVDVLQLVDSWNGNDRRNQPGQQNP